MDQARIDEFHTRGYTIVPGVLTHDEAQGMRPLLQKAVDEDLARWSGNPHYIDHWMVHNLMLRGEPFLRLLENPVMHDGLSAVLDDKCILYAYTTSSMPPQGVNYSGRVHVDSPRLIPGYVTNVGFLLALDEFTDETGATYVLPGSHTRADTPSEKEFYDGAERVYLKPGQAMLFNARLFHAGGRNSSGRPRHAVTMNVCRSYMRQRFDYPRLVPPELIAQLGPVGRRFLGFNVRVPTSLEEYYVPPEQRLYLGGQG